MINFTSSSVQMNQLKGFDKNIKDIDKYIEYYARTEKVAPNEIKINKEVFKKVAAKGLAFAKKQSDSKEISKVAIFHRGFQIISE